MCLSCVCLHSSATYSARKERIGAKREMCFRKGVPISDTFNFFFIISKWSAPRTERKKKKKHCQSTATGCHRWLRHNHIDAAVVATTDLHIVLCVKVKGGVERFVKYCNKTELWNFVDANGILEMIMVLY